MNQAKTYLFFGNIGAGKGTQVELLKKALEEKIGGNVVYISPGEEFRKLTKGESYTSILIKELLNKGELFPAFLTSYVISQVFMSSLKSKDDHIILDGFPRTLPQVEIFESVVKFYERKNIEIVYLKISKEESIKRLKLRGRHDDTDAGIAMRFEEYENKVLPSLALLKEKEYPVFEIDGERSVEEIHSDILKHLKIQ